MMPTRAIWSPVAALLLTLLTITVPSAADSPPGPRARGLAGPPEHLETSVAPGRTAIKVSWDPPTTGVQLVVGYEVIIDGVVVDTVGLTTNSATINQGLRLGRTYDVGVRATLLFLNGETASNQQTLHIAPVTTKQSENRSNPLAGKEWGVYTGLQDPSVIGWTKLGQADRDRLAAIPMSHKAKFFGRWITDDQAYKKTREYITDTQAGNPDRLTFLTLFRMFPWEGEDWITRRLPTSAEQAAYKKYVTGVANGIGNDKVVVVLQPDGYFAKVAYDVHVKKLGRHKALLPARMLAWTAKTLSAKPHTTVYVDMGSEDWARGNVAAVATFLKHSGVQYARGFSLNVSHKNYLNREIIFAKKVSVALAKMGLKNKHAVIDTSDNGKPFAGAEINPGGIQTPGGYTPPGDINPCTSKDQNTPCTALGVPPTTDVDNPRWGLSPTVAKTAAKYVDAYLWVSRPWLPHQGRGGTMFSPDFATRLLKTWGYSPEFRGTP